MFFEADLQQYLVAEPYVEGIGKVAAGNAGSMEQSRPHLLYAVVLPHPELSLLLQSSILLLGMRS